MHSPQINYPSFNHKLQFGKEVSSSEVRESASKEEKNTETSPKKDVFCRIINNDIPARTIAERETMTSMFDANPVTPGHALVFPKRHITSFFETTEQERNDLYGLLKEVKQKIELACERNGQIVPDAYNIGINDGPEAGQTVPHLHIHLIPRSKGDMEDPTGGVRGVIPEKQKYIKSAPPSPEEDKFYKLLKEPDTK